MAPCSYINDTTTKDIGSLLLVKVSNQFPVAPHQLKSHQHVLLSFQRKVGNEGKLGKKRDRVDNSREQKATVNVAYGSNSIPTFENSQYPPAVGQPTPGSQPVKGVANTIQRSHKELARVAVGKGIRHSFSVTTTSMLPLQEHAASITERSVEVGLSALTDNYKNSLRQGQAGTTSGRATEQDPSSSLSTTRGYFPRSLSCDDSLVDLAMIPLADDANPPQSDPTGLTFIDFPWQDPSHPPDTSSN